MMYKHYGSGIYCLINESKKRVYISYSKDIITSLSRIVRDIRSKNVIYKQLIKDVRGLEFLLLEDINIYDSEIDVCTKLDYFITLYKQLGYELYNDKYKLQKFKVSLEVDLNDNLVYVKLVNKRYKKIVVGVFDKMYDAEEFATLFETMDIIKPIYSINNLTKSYILDLKK
jgi:hypothetical protein